MGHSFNLHLTTLTPTPLRNVKTEKPAECIDILLKSDGFLIFAGNNTV